VGLSSRLSLFYFLHFAYGGAMVAYFPLYLAGRGLRPGEIALVLALPQLARIVAPPAWGSLADRSGAQRGIVAFSCAAAAAGCALLPYAGGLPAIAGLVGAMSLLSAAALPLVESITLGSLAGHAGRYGPIRLWGSIGFIAVVLAGGMWLDVQPVATLPVALVLFMLAALVVALALPAGGGQAAAQSPALPLTPAARRLLAAGFCMSFAHGTLYAFLTLHLEHLGYSGSAIGVLWTIGVLAEIAVFLYLPQLFRGFALSRLLQASFLCAVLRFAAIAWGASELWIVAAAQLLHGATFGVFHAASVAAVHRVFPQAAQARGQTLFSSVSYGAGGAAGLLAAGWAWEVAGPAMAFSLAALAAIPGLHLAYTLKRAGL
jgi:PPP family 3-phenylpropionic acid transporter